MTDFTPEFGSPAAGFDPVGESLLLGVEPMVAGLFLLLLLGVGALCWMLGRREGAAEGPDNAPAEIHKRVLAASEAALSARSDRLHEKAGDLRAAIEDLLGPVIVVAKGFGAKVTALDEAIKGEVKDDAAKSGSKADGSPPAVTLTLSGPPPPAPDKPKARKMDRDQQIDALAKAVRGFHDHWSQKEVRIRELKDARGALSRMPPRQADPGHKHGAGDHGDAHEDGHGKRIWDR